MNWEAAGAIGEIIGAVAVVSTLIYLSIQIAGTKKAAESQASQRSMDMYSSWRSMLVQNSVFVEVLAKANDNLELSPGEKIQLEAFTDEYFFAILGSHAMGAHSGSVHDLVGEIHYFLDVTNRNPCLIPQWHRFRANADIVSPDFASAIDNALSRSQDINDI